MNQDTFNNLAAVLMDGNFLALDSVIPDQAAVDVLTPLAGGAVRRTAAPRHLPPPCPHAPASL
ncbi:MAG TPA: hypothetical protein VLQ94_05955 [Candidatus Binatia bacterium]|nr:hypothetical protein [Candidatus Binatia bacterium]